MDAYEYTGEAEQPPIRWYDPGHGYKTLDLKISEADYYESMNKPIFRYSNHIAPSLWTFVTPNNEYVQEISEYLTEVCKDRTPLNTVKTALSFVQSTQYALDEYLYGQSEYRAYPVECLRNRAGDCEDTSILLISILKAMGYDCVFFDYPGHIAVGVALEDCKGLGSHEYDGKRYYYCETTLNAPTVGMSDAGAGSVKIIPERAENPVKELVGKCVVLYSHIWNIFIKNCIKIFQ